MRDYDKEPIIIKDMNLLFILLRESPLIFACLLIAVLKPGTNILFCAILMFVPTITQYAKYKNKRLVKLTNNKIYFLQENNELENIDLSTDFEIYKTFEPIYHKSQKLSNYNKFVHFALFPFMPLLIILGVIGKFSYYLFSRNLKEYRLFDAYLIKQDEKIINITMLNKNIQKEVDVYLKQRIKIEPKNLKMFFDKSGYAYEKIELKG